MNIPVDSDEYYNGQVLQDKYILKMLNNKQQGYFLELGANEHQEISNTYLLEKSYGWKGIMVEYDPKFADAYKTHRPNSFHAIDDATIIDYKDALMQVNFPKQMDYLQVDLDPGNGSTLKALKNLDATIFDEYTFAVATFEHDVCLTQGSNKVFLETREESRAIFEKRGYVRVFKDVNNDGWWEVEKNRKLAREHKPYTPITQPYTSCMYPFEDWYVHPSLVDMTYVQRVLDANKDNYMVHPLCGTTINFKAMVFPPR
jgi:hypothetical protein